MTQQGKPRRGRKHSHRRTKEPTTTSSAELICELSENRHAEGLEFYENGRFFPVYLGLTIGRYIIKAKLGDGAHSTIWLALHLDSPFYYALKINSIEYMMDKARAEGSHIQRLSKFVRVVGCDNAVYKPFSIQSMLHPKMNHIVSVMPIAGISVSGYLNTNPSFYAKVRIALNFTTMVKTLLQKGIRSQWDLTPYNFVIDLREDVTGQELEALGATCKSAPIWAVRCDETGTLQCRTLPKHIPPYLYLPVANERLAELVDTENFPLTMIDVGEDSIAHSVYRSTEALRSTGTRSEDKVHSSQEYTLWMLLCSLYEIITCNHLIFDDGEQGSKVVIKNHARFAARSDYDTDSGGKYCWILSQLMQYDNCGDYRQKCLLAGFFEYGFREKLNIGHIQYFWEHMMVKGREVDIRVYVDEENKAREEAEKKAAEEAKHKAAEKARKKAAEEAKQKAAEEAKKKKHREKRAAEEKHPKSKGQGPPASTSSRHKSGRASHHADGGHSSSTSSTVRPSVKSTPKVHKVEDKNHTDKKRRPA